MTPKKDIQGHILIADDEPSTVELLSDFLTDEGYDVVGVGSGTAVLDKLQGEHNFGLLLMDLEMPGLNGLDLFERLRKEGNDIPVILITAHGTSSVAIRAMQMGVYDYLQKPFVLDEVLVVVKRLFEHQAPALPETLIESELFGHEKGAFTGAVAQRKGRFEQAHKGTIFLDEVGEITLPVQKKLLRVLQEGEIERVGGTGVVTVDVRVLAATNRDLLEEVKKGNFREDLYYRLNVIDLHMPPLRERRSDITILIEHFLDKYRFKPGAPPTKISEEAIEMLERYDWPGNVRQLENEIERAVVLSQGNVIVSHNLNLSQHGIPTQIDLATRVRNRENLTAVLAEVERVMLFEALQQSDGDEKDAAQRLGLSIEEFKKRLSASGGG